MCTLSGFLYGHVSAMSPHLFYSGFNYPYSPKAKPDANLPAQLDGMLVHLGGS